MPQVAWEAGAHSILEFLLFLSRAELKERKKSLERRRASEGGNPDGSLHAHPESSNTHVRLWLFMSPTIVGFTDVLHKIPKTSA